MSKIKQVKIPLIMEGDELKVVKGELIKFKLTKVTDDYFGGTHPNGIDEGWSQICESESLPKVKFSWYMSTEQYNMFATSAVTEIISETPEGGVFKTLNSTYKWEVISE